MLGVLLLFGCDGGEDVLAPYQGTRPLLLQRVTQSAFPDVQWVGGRVAVVGVNRGPRAALDSTLVWLSTAGANDISSPVRLGADADTDAIRQAGGTLQDSLVSGAEYTFWLAERSAFEAGLEGGAVDAFSFADTTLTLAYELRGRSAGDPNLGVTFTIVRNQTLLSDDFTITWTPADVAFRRIAIRRATVGGFTDLAWHVVLPDDAPDSILPPATIGVPPPGTLEVQPWSGFEPTNHVLWMVTSDWDGESFGFRTDGYAFFQIFANNFE